MAEHGPGIDIFTGKPGEGEYDLDGGIWEDEGAELLREPGGPEGVCSCYSLQGQREERPNQQRY